MKTWAIAALLLPLNFNVSAAPPARALADLQCVSYGDGPKLECIVKLKSGGVPLAGAQVTLGAHMPSMPMAHSVKPITATATTTAGEYRGILQLEMEGPWAVQIDVTAGAPTPVRDRIVKSLQIFDCDPGKRCPTKPNPSR
jgi:hypothetical protein